MRVYATVRHVPRRTSEGRGVTIFIRMGFQFAIVMDLIVSCNVGNLPISFLYRRQVPCLYVRFSSTRPSRLYVIRTRGLGFWGGGRHRRGYGHGVPFQMFRVLLLFLPFSHFLYYFSTFQQF